MVNENDCNGPLVSIFCATYNHVNFIAKCLEGFLNQRTDFDFEVLVHDDASTDGTTEIIREYEKKFPKLIKPIYQTFNQFSQGVRRVMFIHNIPRTKGKYIALCEGDDYWTDPYKLQKQVDFLEGNPEYVISTHNVEVRGINNYTDWFAFSSKCVDINLEDWIKGYPAQTSSYVFHSYFIKDFPDWFTQLSIGDVPLVLLLMVKSKLKCGWIPNKMSVYRIHDNGNFQVSNTHDFEKKIIQTQNLIKDFEIMRMKLETLPKQDLIKKIADLHVGLIELNWYAGDYFKALFILLRSFIYFPRFFVKKRFHLFISLLKSIIKSSLQA